MKIDKNILKWFEGNASKEEINILKQENDYETFDKIAFYSQFLEPPKVDVDSAYQQFLEKTNNRNKKQKVISINYKTIFKYAAIFLLCLAPVYFIITSSKTKISTAVGEQKEFLLPDNSKVLLNANSQIAFVEKKWNQNRYVNLEGEAYFNVEKGKTFTVNTDDGAVTVVGTEFNVKQRKHYFEVKCYEGEVLVNYQNKNIALTQGRIFKVINNKVAVNSTFDIREQAWMQAVSYFKSTPLQMVLDEVENQFNYRIVTKNVDVNVLFTGGFNHKSIDLAMQSITLPLQLSYQINGNQITITPYEN